MLDLRSCARVFLCSLALLTAVAPASADLVPDRMTHVSVDLTFDGQAAFTDTSFVVIGCNNDRHQIGFVKPDGPLRCGTKMPPIVYAVPTKDLKPLEDLYAKDLGWALEGIEARKLLEKTPACGNIEEQTLVEKSKQITLLTARYALEKTASGCSMKKVGETIAQTAGSAAVSPASASPNASAPAAAETPTSVPTKSAGCGGCASAASSRTDTGLASIGLVLGSLMLAARRRDSARSSKAS